MWRNLRRLSAFVALLTLPITLPWLRLEDSKALPPPPPYVSPTWGTAQTDNETIVYACADLAKITPHTVITLAQTVTLGHCLDQHNRARGRVFSTRP